MPRRVEYMSTALNPTHIHCSFQLIFLNLIFRCFQLTLMDLNHAFLSEQPCTIIPGNHCALIPMLAFCLSVRMCVLTLSKLWMLKVYIDNISRAYMCCVNISRYTNIYTKLILSS